jgi:hypothetical protein
LIVLLLSGLKLKTRHSLHNEHFKAFGSDIDLTVIGKKGRLEYWRFFHKVLSTLNPRIGEWQFYTDDEYHFFQKLKEHELSDFWKYIIALRKLSWLKEGFKPGQEFKQKKGYRTSHATS